MPSHRIVVLNRLSTKNFVEDISAGFQVRRSRWRHRCGLHGVLDLCVFLFVQMEVQKEQQCIMWKSAELDAVYGASHPLPSPAIAVARHLCVRACLCVMCLSHSRRQRHGIRNVVFRHEGAECGGDVATEVSQLPAATRQNCTATGAVVRGA